MRLSVPLLFCLLLAGAPATAQTITECNPTQTALLRDVFSNAKTLTINAAAAVGDTPEYARWFGAYSDRNADIVRANLKAVVTAIRTGAVEAQCETIRDDGCTDGEYAWVYAHEPYKIYFCPAYFNLPPLVALRPGTTASNNGTREGTIVHEISHFNPVARTEDHCYTRRVCTAMASTSPSRAIENADSYQYFTEDVTYYARQPLSGKTTP
jgi:peptidyl-Lys metalloendopeptidase